MHGRRKHIRVCFHFLPDLVKDKEVNKFEAFHKHRKNIEMVDLGKINLDNVGPLMHRRQLTSANFLTLF